MDNRISFVLTEEEKGDINQAVEILVNVLQPKLHTLLPEERREMPKMGDKTVAFVEKALEYGQEYPQYMPAFIDVPEALVDFEAVKSMRIYFTQLERLSSQLDDSMMLAGSEAYTSALSIYKVLKNAAAMGQPGAEQAVHELASRFPRGKQKQASEAS